MANKVLIQLLFRLDSVWSLILSLIVIFSPVVSSLGYMEFLILQIYNKLNLQYSHSLQYAVSSVKTTGDKHLLNG